MLNGVTELVKQFIYPDNTMRNYQAFLPFVEGMNASNMFTLCDPQTNGGLMLTVNNNFKKEFETLCAKNNILVIEIGIMKKAQTKTICIS